MKEKFNRLMFWNYWVGFLNETYLFLTVCVLLNYYYFVFDSYGNAINSLLSAFFGVTLVLFPFFIGIFYNEPKKYALVMS